MVMNEHSPAVGVFTGYDQAEQAIDELRRVGFSDDEISVSRGGATTGGVIESLKGLFTKQEPTALTTADDFIRVGVPEQDASYYQSELAAGRTIVVVRATGLRQEALGILRHYGAYDAATRQP